MINPYATDEFARILKQALEAPPEETRRRMTRLRDHVRENNVYRWAAEVIGEMQKLEA